MSKILNSNRISVVTLCIFIGTFSLNAQLIITQQIQDRIEGKLPKEKLDNAMYRCIYYFTQQVKNKETEEITFLTDTMVLEIGKNFSVYYDWNKSFRDSLQRATTKEISQSMKHIEVNRRKNMAEYKDIPGSYTITSPKGESARIYKNRREQEIIIIDGNEQEMFKCIEIVPAQQWLLTADTLTVLGYVCQKATTTFRGRTYEAWFTSEIPVKEGPWKLYGPPGLILKASADGGIFVFEAIGLENVSKKTSITMDKDTYTKASREQLAKMTAEKRKKRDVQHVSGGNVTVGSTPNPFEFELIELK
ncbi:MAG: GLPGLI family protein [Bacteroidia bacterium]|nr:GLPGLI family protein [Bacteroidia bacterium]